MYLSVLTVSVCLYWLYQEELIFLHLEPFWQNLRLPSYRITTDSFIQVYCWCIVHNTAYHSLIVWVFLRGLCCTVIQLYTPSSSDSALRITYAGSSSHNLSTMTSTCVHIIASSRAQWCGSTSSVRVQRVSCQCTTGRFNSNEVRNAMRRRCDAALQRQCDHAVGDAGAQKLAQKPAQKPGQAFLAKIQEDSDTHSSRYVQVFWTWTVGIWWYVGIWYPQVGIWSLCVGMSGELPSHTYHVNLRYLHIVTHTFR